jgi:hypothetical protein
MKTLDRMQAKHNSVVDELTKMRDKRDISLNVLIRAEGRYRSAVKAVARSQRRIDKAREEEQRAKIARKQAKAESQKEIPDISAIVPGSEAHLEYCTKLLGI